MIAFKFIQIIQEFYQNVLILDFLHYPVFYGLRKQTNQINLWEVALYQSGHM